MKNKTILITGGASGIGLAMTKRFAEEGGNVYFIDYDQKTGEKVAEELTSKGHRVTFLQGDVSQTEEMKQTISSIS